MMRKNRLVALPLTLILLLVLTACGAPAGTIAITTSQGGQASVVAISYGERD